jgi:hypothetical protein
LIRYLAPFLLASLLLVSCESDQPPLRIPDGGVDLDIGQRKRHEIQGYHGGIAIELDDITRSQVVVRILHDSQVLASQSMSEGVSIDFTIKDEAYFLRLDKLINQMIGRDNAIFRLAKKSDWQPINTAAGISSLLERIRTAGADYVFIRNGGEYSPEKTAAHLEMKWKNHGAIRSMDQFIEEIATKSSQSGKLYMVRHLDEEPIPLAEWLQSEIRNSQ